MTARIRRLTLASLLVAVTVTPAGKTTGDSTATLAPPLRRRS